MGFSRGASAGRGAEGRVGGGDFRQRRAPHSHHAAVCAGKELLNNALKISTRIRASLPYVDQDLKYNLK
jgi:hypothetical protein